MKNVEKLFLFIAIFCSCLLTSCQKDSVENSNRDQVGSDINTDDWGDGQTKLSDYKFIYKDKTFTAAGWEDFKVEKNRTDFSFIYLLDNVLVFDTKEEASSVHNEIIEITESPKPLKNPSSIKKRSSSYHYTDKFYEYIYDHYQGGADDISFGYVKLYNSNNFNQSDDVLIWYVAYDTAIVWRYWKLNLPSNFDNKASSIEVFNVVAPHDRRIFNVYIQDSKDNSGFGAKEVEFTIDIGNCRVDDLRRIWNEGYNFDNRISVLKAGHTDKGTLTDIACPGGFIQ